MRDNVRNIFGEDPNPLKTSPEQPLKFVVFDFKRDFYMQIIVQPTFTNM
jgi:hypothetical protein